MGRKKKISHICKFCGAFAEMRVDTDDDGYTVIKCNKCKSVVVEGYGDAEELLEENANYDNDYN